MEPIYSDHSRIDARSLAMHRLVAAKLRANPAILDEARDTLRRWQKMDGSPALALSEWENILSAPVAQVSQFLEERSERANRLRQSSPFAGVLTDAERRTIYESFATRTYHPGGQPDFG
ncbi:hypothetical protein [Sphingomonas sp.]|uniref:hypothetical protein n=1 Tax=Sphingomonas sp. TaxID=28214 RepID=UPI0025D761FC|nr:hypothetical protein [Sphingomonas sp.]MBV9528724.1 hypothetical protein [Sphingomonas sp.]